MPRKPIGKTTDMALLEARDTGGRDITAIIRDAYAQAGSLRGAGELMGVDGSTLVRWMRRLGLRVGVVQAEPQGHEEMAV